MDCPSWFKWFQDLGNHLATQPTVKQGNKALRLIISVPNADFVPWAILSGALVTNKIPSRELSVGERVVTWTRNRMQDSKLYPPSGNQRLRWDGGGVMPGHEWPIAHVPDDAPTGRSVRPVSELDKQHLRDAWGKHWYIEYAKKCVLPVTLLGQKSELLGQLNQLTGFCGSWFAPEVHALLKEDSMQVTNPNRFGMFPFMVLNQSTTLARPWLRQMESRLVISSTFASRTGLSRYFQQGVPQVTLVDRRSTSSGEAHDFVRELIAENNAVNTFKYQEPPPGVYLHAYSERVLEDLGHDETADDLEGYEL